VQPLGIRFHIRGATPDDAAAIQSVQAQTWCGGVRPL